MSRKIALLGNMNNNLFNMCRYLRDRGYDATLFIFPYDSAHFMPEADSFDDSYTAYVKRLNWGNPYELNAVSKQEIVDEFKDFDFIIGCGTAPAFLSKAHIKLDLFAPYGSDLYHYPFFNLFSPKRLVDYFLNFFKNSEKAQALPSRPANWQGYIPFVLNQRKGIRQSRNCAVLSSGQDAYSKSLKRLAFRNNYFRFTIPMIYTGQYNETGIAKYQATSKWYDQFRKIRESHDFLIFANCRHCWKNEKDPVSFKGNDRLFEGFRKFVTNYSGKAAIITFEYGTDYPESKKLCNYLEISKHVFWFPLLERKELMIGMNMSDLVVGNLSDASWATYGIVYESMTLRKAIMHHRNDSLYPKDVLYPMVNAFSSEMVASNLQYYSRHPEQLQAIGEGAHKWFIKNCIDYPINEIIRMIEFKS